ncbi:hypothetical protein LP419_15245 [Massilia sp. H-1]|nr:hypothetical protein LP419_15245 [Massilia sp. H-1]
MFKVIKRETIKTGLGTLQAVHLVKVPPPDSARAAHRSVAGAVARVVPGQAAFFGRSGRVRGTDAGEAGQEVIYLHYCHCFTPFSAAGLD